ncbi:hypothetical protein [Streptomyces olivaceiscleroticus]|uniref:Uncharacterized protein n=1 Tax=Streptomyces olivaceiscleroticus TaxID=68245 RepID=A0ABN1BM20_9ACTN
MGNDEGDTRTRTNQTAAARMRLLTAEHLTPTRGAPTHGRTATMAHSPAPVDLDTVDYLSAARTEAITFTRRHAPDAGPAPADAADVYAWMDEHTQTIQPAAQDQRRTLEIRHALEAHLRIDRDDSRGLIRRHRCPRCHCLGVVWSEPLQRAVCGSGRCVDNKARPSTWSVYQLAEARVADQNRMLRTAT